MDREQLANTADETLDPAERAQLVPTPGSGLVIMVHGGDVGHSPKLANGLTKREQIRKALLDLPYVADAFFATDPAEEKDLFDKSDGTVVLVESDPFQSGARHEIAVHAYQDKADHKLCVLFPKGDEEFEGMGYLRSLMWNYLNPLNLWAYSVDDYFDCYLVPTARAFVEGLLSQTPGADPA